MDRAKASALVTEVFDTWAPCLARHAWHATGDRALADDLVQEAFLALYQALRSDKEIANPRAWTLTVVRHYASRHLRDRRRHGEQPAPEGSFDSLADPRAVQLDPAHEELPGMMAVLTEREEEVVLLRIECFKYREIADQLGLNAKTVATLLARALRKLQRAFEAGGRPVPSRRKESNVPKTLQ